MSPPAVAERADTVADNLDFIRSGLTPSERDRFDLEFFDVTRNGSKDEVVKVLSTWLLTVLVRMDPAYKEQYEGFVHVARSGNPFGDQAAETPQAEAV